MTLKALDKWWRVGGAAGIIFVVLFVIAFAIVGDEPAYTDKASEIKTWFVDNRDSWRIGVYLFSIGAFLFYLPFLSALTSFLGNAEGQPPVWSRVAMMGGFAFLILTFLSTAGEGALTLIAKDLGDDAVKALFTLSQYLFPVTGFAIAALTLGSSVVILRTGVLSSWLGWYGVVPAAVGVIGAAGIFADDPQGFLFTVQMIGLAATGIWVLAASVGMLRLEEASRMMAAAE